MYKFFKQAGVECHKPTYMQLIFENVHGTGEIYMDCLKAICGDTEGKSMVDLCCCTAPNTPLLGFKERTYVDVLPRVLDHPGEQEFFVQKDVIDFLGEASRCYDVAICSDGIEHLTKPDGFELINLAMSAANRSVFFTPLGDHLVGDDDNPENHHSGWTPGDLEPHNYHNVIAFPHYHKLLNVGAFFFWACCDLEGDFARVFNLLNNKSWATEAKLQK
jgi:hypothetical protein